MRTGPNWQLTGSAAIAVACCCVLVGCGNGGSNFTFKAPKGSDILSVSSGDKGVYPTDMPIAKYPNSSVAFEAGDTGAKSSKQSVQLSSTDSTGVVADFYKNLLSQGGWKVDSNADVGGLYLFHATNGESKVTITLTPAANSGSSIQLWTSAKR